MSALPISQFEADSGLRFRNKELLRTAFVHSSYGNEAPETDGVVVDNERLEFLGDSVLGFVVSEYLYERFPEMKEGPLTALRAALVRREALARLARQLRLGEYLLLGRGEDESGGRRRPATLCATFEAVIGALYLDQGLDAVRSALLPMIVQQLELVQHSALHKDVKSRLQEWSQSAFGAAPRYRVIDTSGPDHAKEFTTEVTILGVRCGLGKGRSKQEASTLAAAQALANLALCTPEDGAPSTGEQACPEADLEGQTGLLAKLQAAAGVDARSTY